MNFGEQFASRWLSFTPARYIVYPPWSEPSHSFPMSFSKLVLLFVAFVASAGALSSPHPRGIHHRALAGRITVPESPLSPPLPVRRRQNSKRCKSRPSSAALIVSTKDATSTKEATHTREATHTKEATPTKEVVPTKEAPTTKETEAPKPTTHETTHEASPTPKPAPPPTTKEEAPAPTKEPSPPPTSNLPSFLTGLNTGDATFYASRFSYLLHFNPIYLS